jgi:hypothetical protein
VSFLRLTFPLENVRRFYSFESATFSGLDRNCAKINPTAEQNCHAAGRGTEFGISVAKTAGIRYVIPAKQKIS